MTNTNDSFPLKSLYFYLTEGCNLQCRHCWIAPKFQSGDRVYSSLDLELFIHIIEQAMPLGLSSVKLTGGEPLLHPRISDMLHLIRERDLHLTIETNGVLCATSVAREIAACRNPFVAVSLDGADAETHEWVRGVPGCFQETLQGIKNLVNAGLRPQVIMSLMRRNRDQLEHVVRLAEALGAASVKFNLVQPTARGEKMHKTSDALSIHEMLELGRWVENDLSAAVAIPLHYSFPHAFRSLGKMFGDARNDCGVCGIFGILGVLSSGSYALCGIGETVPELIFGHAARDPLADVWTQSPVLREIREGLPHRLEGVCAQCIMRSFCLGSCIAQNFYRGRHLWAGHWFCEEAMRDGLFPHSRSSEHTETPERQYCDNNRPEMRG